VPVSTAIRASAISKMVSSTAPHQQTWVMPMAFNRTLTNSELSLDDALPCASYHHCQGQEKREDDEEDAEWLKPFVCHDSTNYCIMHEHTSLAEIE
jgi:hypothetical protein